MSCCVLLDSHKDWWGGGQVVNVPEVLSKSGSICHASPGAAPGADVTSYRLCGDSIKQPQSRGALETVQLISVFYYQTP